eukprot:evm.model.scf_375EXC.4 EVM.evm.TU.scf_375EXC.4   scf_375EXC:55822-57139(-)
METPEQELADEQQVEQLDADWGYLPFQILENVVEALAATTDARSSIMKSARLVNRHWGTWATEAVTFLQHLPLSGSPPLRVVVSVVRKKFKRAHGLKFDLQPKHIESGFGFQSRGVERELAALAGLPELRHVIFKSCTITDEGLRHVGKLESLTRLQLSNSVRITDAGLQHLRSLTGLQYLTLSGCRGNWDRQLEPIGKLAELKHLEVTLDRCLGWITDRSIIHLGALAALERLQLTDTQITDRGLEELNSLKRLRHLDLSRSRITGRGLGQLFGLTGLAELRVCGCGGIRDEEFTFVEVLVGLTALDVLGCWRVSKERREQVNEYLLERG